MSEHYVLKFGGSSMAQPEVSAEIFANDPDHNQIAVVSGVGIDRRDPQDATKVTDWLIRLEDAVRDGDHVLASEAQEAVITKNRRAFDALGSPALDRFDDIAHKLMSPDNSRDGYRWIGEHLSARMFAELTGAMYVSSGLRFKQGKLHLEKSLGTIRQTVGPIIRSGTQVATEGFFGCDLKSDRIVTLERGASDISGVIYTGAFHRETGPWINKNYTDKDGILTADPELVPNASVIPEMTHDEVREKMHGVTERNGVVHGDAIVYAAKLGVEMVVMNTFNPNAITTRIVSIPKRNCFSVLAL